MKNMIKALSRRFPKYLERFHIMTPKACSEMALFRELSNQHFHSLQFQKYISYDDHLFFLRCLKFEVDSRNGIKNREKVFCFSDNCMGIGSCKFAQYSIGYLPSEVNLLTNTPKISHNTRGDIFQINFSENDKVT